MNEARFAEMISKIAHELRSPLTSLKGFSSTLTKRWDRFTDEQRYQFVETIHQDADRMARIVAEILDLARLESGRLELNLQIAPLGPLAEEAARSYAALPGADRVTIEIEEGLSAWADPARLAHVLGNLIENAIKFSDEGPISVRGRRTNGTVEISVSDRGVGIVGERVAELFSGPAPPGQSTGPTGAGLGLYLTKRLVDVHGGSISVESTPGEGSTFTVTLPATRDAA